VAGVAATLLAGQTLVKAFANDATPPASPPGDNAGIVVTGEVDRPGTLTVADLQALPVETVDVTFLLQDGTKVAHTYSGARLWDVLQLAEPIIDAERPETSLHLYLVLTARDGYVVVLSMGEIDPEFGGYPYLLAWSEDGQPISDERGPAILVPPGDRTEGRYIFGIVSIEVRSVEDSTDG
jgi:DMSO/TMAO reductase YedYZ molybdopterin-dependent catalytic subunit